jgi:predicted transcriptional regulator
MTEDKRQAEEVCSICGEGQSLKWECPQCGREIQEADAAYGERRYREGRAAGIEEMRDAALADNYEDLDLERTLQAIASRLLASAPPEQDDLSPEALASVKRGLAQKATIDRGSFATCVEGTETITTSEVTKRALAPPETPNIETRQAMADTDAGRVVTATGVNNLFVKLDAPDILAPPEVPDAFANDWNRARADKALAGAQEPGEGKP